MTEDKRIKDLLMNAMEEPSSTFSDNVMRKIELISKDNKQRAYLLHDNFLRILAAAFVIIAVLLFCINIYTDEINFQANFKNLLTNNYIIQIIQFLIAFWIVMLTNSFIRRKKKQLMN